MLVLQHLVTVLMFAVGLAMTPRVLRVATHRLPEILRALVVLLAGVPMIALAVVTALRLEPGMAMLIPVAAVCAGTPFSPRRDRPIVPVILALVAVLVPLTGPLWLRLAHLDIAVPLASIAERQVVPLGLGIAIAALWPRLAERLDRVVWYVFDLAIVAAAVVVLYRAGGTVLPELTPRAIAAEVLLVAWSATLGHWAGRPDPRDRHAIAMLAVAGNPALVVALLPSVAMAALVALHVLVRLVLLLPYTLAPYLSPRRRSVT
jgi:BASS family bile acid:Na+ symporter